jgi:exodeoxyribonuclease VII large subunit
MHDTIIGVTELVELINQTLDFAYPVVVVEGEVANFRVSKGRWVYFDLKDSNSTVRFFASVYSLNSPIEDGMMVRVTGNPRLHNLYGFSVTVQSLQLSGEGTIKRAQELLKAKLEAEGLFEIDRKRELPKYPKSIGLVASSQSAAYGDFMKIINGRWGGLEINLIDVQVQGEPAIQQIVSAINQFSGRAEAVDVVVVIRGGGSPEDLAAFSAEPVVRAVAASRIPTIVGIGHENDISLAELAADQRASTPTNAAQIVVPDRQEVISEVNYLSGTLHNSITNLITANNHRVEVALQLISSQMLAPSRAIDDLANRLSLHMDSQVNSANNKLLGLNQTLSSLDPKAVLRRGYGLIRQESGQVVRSAKDLRTGQQLMIEFGQGRAKTEVIDVEK